MTEGTSPSSTRADEGVLRRGRVSWLTHPPSGSGRVGVDRLPTIDSTTFHAVPVSLPEGDPDPEAATPGELLAVAHATFMAAALAEGLTYSGSPASEIVVEAVCAFAGPFPERDLVALDFNVSGNVPGVDAAGFRHAAESARSRSLRSVAARDDLPGELQVELY